MTFVICHLFLSLLPLSNQINLISILCSKPVDPSAPPTSFQVTGLTSSSITVQWGAVDCIHRNGDITGYSVRYGVQGSGSTQTESVSGGATTEATISGLTPSTSYVIDIAAVNSAGIGVYSESLTVETSVAGEASHLQAVLLWLLAHIHVHSIRCLCQVPGSGSLQPQLCEPHCSGGCYCMAVTVYSATLT